MQNLQQKSYWPLFFSDTVQYASKCVMFMLQITLSKLIKLNFCVKQTLSYALSPPVASELRDMKFASSDEQFLGIANLYNFGLRFKSFFAYFQTTISIIFMTCYSLIRLTVSFFTHDVQSILYPHVAVTRVYFDETAEAIERCRSFR